jgi:transcriptional regulator with XRE-family HTH domain
VTADRRERRQDGGFAVRLRQVLDSYGGSTAALAKRIARSEGAVRKWLRGESEPNVTDLRSLCDETRTSVEWLVAGRGSREATPLAVREPEMPYGDTGRSVLDQVLLENIIRAVEDELQAAGLTLAPTKRAMLVVTLYDLCHERGEVDHDAVARLVKLAG